MEQLLQISNSLLMDAELALRELKHGDYLKAKKIIDILVDLSEHELRLVLANIQITEDKMYYFDLKKKTEEIYCEAKKAKEYVEKGEFNRIKDLLKVILSLEKEVIKKERDHREEIILASKVAAEAAILLFIRNRIDPYVQYMGHQIDIVDYKITHIGEFLEYKWNSLKEALTFWKKKTEKKSELTVTTEKIYSQYAKVTSHPVYIPHLRRDEPYAHIFSDALYLTFLTVFAYIVLFKNIPKYIRKKLETRKIRKIYEALTSQFSKQIEVFRQQAIVQNKEILNLGAEVDRLEKEVQALPQTMTKELANMLIIKMKELREKENFIIQHTERDIVSGSKNLSNDVSVFVKQLTEGVS